MTADGQPGAFRGWPDAAFEFYARLATDNSKSFFDEHREVYEQAVRAPMYAFGELVRDRYGPLHIYRPHRDLRFTKDKSPYKIRQGAVTEGAGGEVYYVRVGAEGLLAASGYHQMARDQLARYTRAVDDDAAGEELVAITDALATGYRLRGPVLKTAPRGYPRDHPRVELLRHKGLLISRHFPLADWHGTPEAAARITGVWDAAAPMNQWLARHVGPSEEPPDGR